MKPEESIVQKYLDQKKLGVLVYEPDGNIPSDFLLNPDVFL